MRPVAVTGIGMVTCLGHSPAEVSRRLRSLQHGFTRYAPFADNPRLPVSVAAPIPGFSTDSPDPEDWSYPDDVRFRLEQLRALSPNALYAHFALQRAVADAGLSLDQITHPRFGLYTASSGSATMTHHHLARMHKVGPMRCSPLGVVASIAGTLNFNLAAAYSIKGATCGMVSACASSGHALGLAADEIATGRQDAMLVVGAEDFAFETIAPFAAMRVLSPSTDPDSASRPFDAHRDGFVGTGGAVALLLQSPDSASTEPYGYVSGWGQSSDGHHVAASHPEGEGLARALNLTLQATGWSPDSLDYINAHATSTPNGDQSECRALRRVFGHAGTPPISSTKALTGHALSLSAIMEAAFCLIALRDEFLPGSAHITELDPEAEGLHILRGSVEARPRRILSNSSGFGGVNVVLALEKP